MQLETLYDLFSRGARSQFDAQRGLEAARLHTLATCPEDVSTPEARSGVVATFVAEALSRLWLERDWRRDTLDALLESAAQRMAIRPEPLRRAVAMQLLRDPSLLQLPPILAIEAQVRRLMAFGPFEAVSMWAVDEQTKLQCVASTGERDDQDAEAAAAASVLEADGLSPQREPARRHGAEILVIPIIRWQQPRAALTARPEAGQARQCKAVMEYGGSIVGPILEREALLRRGVATERTLVASSERRLERLGLDLHDRPIQDAAVLADDVRLFKRQLTGALAGHQHAGVLAGRVDDLEARLVALHGELRQLSHSLAAPTLLRRPLAELLEAEAETFRDRTEIRLELHVDGDLDSVPNAQRVTLIRIVQEALSNAREHSGASGIRVSVVAHHDRIDALISDDGRGFEVEKTLTSAAERGRLGLVGINERARVVGGTCDIRSRVGRGTAIAVTLPRVEVAEDQDVRASDSRR